MFVPHFGREAVGVYLGYLFSKIPLLLLLNGLCAKYFENTFN